MVEGASFCHRCGKATRELVEREVSDAVAPPAPEAVVPAAVAAAAPKFDLPVNLSNPVAIRVALIVSPMTVLASTLPLVNVLFLLWWIAGGWFAANMYRRITGVAMTVRAGARLGGIIGLMSFVGLSAVVAIEFTFTGKELFQEMVKQNPQVTEVLNNPTALVMVVLLSLACFFVMISTACAAGGALGARFGAKNTTV